MVKCIECVKHTRKVQPCTRCKMREWIRERDGLKRRNKSKYQKDGKNMWESKSKMQI